jgi:hypothetical protein
VAACAHAVLHTPLDLWLLLLLGMHMQVFNQSLQHMHILLVTGTCALMLAALVRAADAFVGALSQLVLHAAANPCFTWH